MKKLLCILCSLLIVLFAATSFAAAGEKRVVGRLYNEVAHLSE